MGRACGKEARSWHWAALFALLATATAAQGEISAADRILGIWLNAEKDGKVAIYRCDGKYCGRIVWLTVPGVKVPLDVNNPDPSLRHRALEGLQVIDGLEYQGHDTWSGGTIYDPRSGNTYSFKATLPDADTLKLRGYVLLPLFGRTVVWRRVEGGDENGLPARVPPTAAPTSAPPP